MAETTDGKLHRIDAHGDTIFVMKDGSRIQVAASIIAGTSDPMNAMLFKTNFREGQARGKRPNDKPLEVDLPEDDPQGMLLTCSLLYQRYSLDTVKSWSSTTGLKVAVTMNQWLFDSKVMQMWGFIFSTRQFSNSSTELELLEWMTAAYLLRSRILFATATNKIVGAFKLPNSLRTVYSESSNLHPMPESMINIVQEHALRSRIDVTDQIYSLALLLLQQEGYSPQLRRLADFLLSWNARSESTDNLLSILSQANQGDSVTKYVSNHKAKSSGLCLDCAKNGSITEYERCSSHQS